MFQASQAVFIYCVSPLHMGAGTALGLIDNPIQRERHTGYPLIAGSGLKGAVRHHFWAQSQGGDRRWLERLFGPDSGQNAATHAGAVSFADAQLLAFPVRSARHGFVYATSPLALARAARLLELTGQSPQWPAFTVQGQTCQVADAGLAGELALEVFQYRATHDPALANVAAWLADNALPAGDAYDFFRNKLKTELVMLPDEEFGYFVHHATVVEPHVRINDESGTADDGGLFYTENLPPESLLITAVMASVERYSKDAKPSDALDATGVLSAVLKGQDQAWTGLEGSLLQIGGDATTGRGQVVLKTLGGA